MAIELKDAKELSIGDVIVVTKTQERWEITGVAPVEGRNRVKLLVNNGRIDSEIDETRLHLFDVAAAPAKQPELPSIEDAAAQLRPAMEAAYKEAQEAGDVPVDVEQGVISEDDADALEQRIADHIADGEPEDKTPKKKASKPKKK